MMEIPRIFACSRAVLGQGLKSFGVEIGARFLFMFPARQAIFMMT